MTIKAYRLLDWTVYPDRNEVVRDGVREKLETRVMQMLVFFCENPDRVISRAELIEAVWGQVEISPNSASVAIGAIRRALDDDASNPRFIETYKKLGYRLKVTPEKLEAAFTAKRSPGNNVLLATAVLIVAAAGVWAWFQSTSVNNHHEVFVSVEPVKNATGDEELDMITETFGDVLVADLAQRGEFPVRKSIPEGLARAIPSNQKLAPRELIISGRLIRDEDGLFVSIHLRDNSSNEILWAGKRHIGEGRVLADVTAISTDLLESQSIETMARDSAPEDGGQAEDLYRMAKQLASIRSNVTIKMAHGLLLRSIEIDREFGPSHWLLAELYSWHYPPSFWNLKGDRFELSERELALAEQYGADEAYLLVTQAGIHLARDRRYDLSREFLERAASLRPLDPWVLRPQIWTNMLFGDFETALKNNRLAVERSLDPSSVLAERVAPLYYSGRISEAYDLFAAAEESGLKPDREGAQAAILLGRHSLGFQHWIDYVRYQGIEIEEESLPLQWIDEGNLAAAYNWLRERSGKFQHEWNYPLVSASWHVASGDNERAVEEIVEAIHLYRDTQEPTGAPGYYWTLFLHDPIFAEVRDDMRVKRAIKFLEALSR